MKLRCSDVVVLFLVKLRCSEAVMLWCGEAGYNCEAGNKRDTVLLRCYDAMRVCELCS